MLLSFLYSSWVDAEAKLLPFSGNTDWWLGSSWQKLGVGTSLPKRWKWCSLVSLKNDKNYVKGHIVSTYLKVWQIPLSWILVYESLVVIGCSIEVLLWSSPPESLHFSRFSNVLFSSASCLFINWINSRLLALDFPLFEMDILDISHVGQAWLTVLNYMQSSIL